MLNVKELRAEMVRNGYTQKDLAKMIGVSEKTFIDRMKRGVFKTDEAFLIAKALKIKNPCKIFFAGI